MPIARGPLLNRGLGLGLHNHVPLPSLLPLLAQALAKLFDPLVAWMAPRYQAVVARELKKYGLRYEDLYDPQLDLVRKHCRSGSGGGGRRHGSVDSRSVRPWQRQGQHEWRLRSWCAARPRRATLGAHTARGH